MLRKIGTVDKIPEFLDTIKQSSRSSTGSMSNIKPIRLMGFGHRIYKTTDPRSKLCKKLTLEVTMVDLGL
jgi:citrate synthase